VGRVQKETEAELVAVNEQLKVVTTGFETLVEQSSTRTKEVIDELANQLVDHRAEVDVNLDKLDHEMNYKFSRQKETNDQVNAKIIALEARISEAPIAAESRAILPPSVVK
jgi:RNase H-fold protein (predicted Holliday junction resolvase)